MTQWSINIINIFANKINIFILIKVRYPIIKFENLFVIPSNTSGLLILYNSSLVIAIVISSLECNSINLKSFIIFVKILVKSILIFKISIFLFLYLGKNRLIIYLLIS